MSFSEALVPAKIIISAFNDFLALDGMKLTKNIKTTKCGDKMVKLIFTDQRIYEAVTTISDPFMKFSTYLKSTFDSHLVSIELLVLPKEYVHSMIFTFKGNLREAGYYVKYEQNLPDELVTHNKTKIIYPTDIIKKLVMDMFSIKFNKVFSVGTLKSDKMAVCYAHETMSDSELGILTQLLKLQFEELFDCVYRRDGGLRGVPGIVVAFNVDSLTVINRGKITGYRPPPADWVAYYSAHRDTFRSGLI